MSGKAARRTPAGFASASVRRTDLVPSASGGPVLTLPAEGIEDGPFLRLPAPPAGGFGAIVVDGWTESMGDLRAALQRLTSTLPPGGGMMLDLANLQAPRMLHRVIEGRPGSFDPAGSLRRAERAVLLADVLEACEATGLLVTDCVAVPAADDELREEFAHNMLQEGFLAAACVDGPPPARWWITARREVTLPGSVLIGVGPAAEQERTRAALASILPAGWEIVRGQGDRELESFNQAVPTARGELLWFLRAGSIPSAELLQNQLARVLNSPSTPADLDPAAAGGICGLLASRLAILATGPLPRSWDAECIAYEEYGLRLSAVSSTPLPVAGAIHCPPPAGRAHGPAAAAAMQREMQQLLARWEPVVNSPFRGERTPETARVEQRVAPWGDARPRVSLCMIVRNEERMLPECLHRAGPVVDEIVIVDTGSDDRTIEIATDAGAKVLHCPWQDDFASARNVGLAAATGDWILVLDADERLAGENVGAQLDRLIADAGVSGYHMVLRNLYDDARTQGVRMVRLFRNLPGIRFENRIHEQITPSLAAAAADSGLILSSCDLLIEHLGYGDEIMRSRRKDERNERIFRLQLRDHPDDIYSLYKFGDFLRRLPGRGLESIGYLDRALDLVLQLPPHEYRTVPYAGEIAALCALEHAREGRLEQADAIVERALTNLMPTPNLHYIAAGLALRAGRNDEAIAHYRRCLRYADQVLVVPIQEGITSHVAITGIAHAWLQKGDLDRAERLLRLSHSICPSYEVTCLNRSRLHFERGEFSESIRVLMDHLAEYPESAGVCQQATLILNRLGMVEQARALGTRAVELLERSALTAEARSMRETVATLT